MTSEVFRANVGIAIVKDGNILIFERSDVPGRWQLPQGGIERGEEPIDAAFRELQEETGLGAEDVSLLGEYPEWLAYELPKELRSPNYMGQVQRWFVFTLLADEAAINLQYDTYQEFTHYRWIPLDQLESISVNFRKNIYGTLTGYISGII